MDINVKFDFVEGSFDTETGKLECVKNTTHSTVKLCFKENMNIPFAKIKLYSSDLLRDANEVLDDAYNLGNEIVKRWNEHSNLIEKLQSLIDIIDESEGITNYHKNGDVAYWSEFEDADKAKELINKIAGHDNNNQNSTTNS